MLEAFIGAMFIDSEFNYELVENFFNAHIRPYFVDMSLYDGKSRSVFHANNSLVN
jgi:endoribonuclease Dicer